MPDGKKTKRQLIDELSDLRQRLAACESVSADAGDRERVAERLQEHTRAQQYLDVAAVIMVVLDSEGKITLLNKKGYEVLGYPDGALLGQDWFGTCVPEHLRAEVLVTFRKLMAGQLEPTEYYENPVATRSGEERIIAWHNALLTDDTGRIVGTLSSGTDITERRQAEDAQRASEAKYRRLHQSMMDAFVSVTMDGRIQEYNEAYRKMLGYEPEELLALRYTDITPEKWHSFEAEIVDKQILRRGFSETYEKEYRKKDGTIFPVELRTCLISDDNGRPLTMWAIVRNITERKQAQEALKKAHDELEQRVEERTAELKTANEELAMFHKFAESSSQGLGMAELDGRIAYVNPAMSRLIGEADPHNAIGKPMWTYYVEGVKERRENEILPALDRDGFWDGELPMLSRQGTLVPPLHHVFLLRDDEGRPIRRCVIVTDLSERKKAEEALRQSERRFRNYFEQGLIGMAVTSVDKRWLEVNDRLCGIMGYSREELLQTGWVALTHPDDIEPNLRLFNRLLAGELDHFILNKRYLKKDGSIVHTTIHTRAFRKDDGTIDHVVTLMEDITARREAEEALEREHHNLRNLLQSSDHERQLIAYEIHDGLAQQLAGAVMQFETFTYRKGTQPQQAEDAFHAGLTMLRQSHFEARRLIAGVRPPILDEAGVVSAIAHLVHEPVRGTAAKITFKSSVDFDRLVPTLENAIYRIVQEGLTNACQHSKTDKVRVSLSQHGDRVRIEIRDWGTGFDVKAVQKNRFGLEGIRQRARLLGGKCSIRSKPGKGTTIIVELPVVARD